MARVKFEEVLGGGDLRSIGKNNFLVSRIQHRGDFDALFEYLHHADRKIVMRAADAIEKVTVAHPAYLVGHKAEILQLCNKEKLDKELKWHLAQLIARLPLHKVEVSNAWTLLSSWAFDQLNSRIVRLPFRGFLS